MLIPTYLQTISQLVKTTDSYELIRIKCKCGCTSFIVYEHSDPIDKRISPGFNEVLRKDNRLYLVKRNFWGRIIKEIECENIFNKQPRKIVKVKCSKCENEYIVFDNYKHGYNAMAFSNSTKLLEDICVNFRKSYPGNMEIFVKIYQDISYAQFHDEFENADYETYLNSFGNIEIYGVNSKQKKIRILSEETS